MFPDGAALEAAERSSREMSELVGTVDDDELCAMTTSVERLRALLEVGEAHLLGELERRDTTDIALGLSTSAWLAQAAGLPRRVTNDRVQTAVKLTTHLPRVLDAVIDGSISYEHARTLAKACNSRIEDGFALVADSLVALAGECTFAAWQAHVRDSVSLLDQDGGHDPAGDDPRNRVSMSTTLDGTLAINSTLIGKQAVEFKAAVEAQTRVLQRRWRKDAKACPDIEVPSMATLRALALVELVVAGRVVRVISDDASEPDGDPSDLGDLFDHLGPDEPADGPFDRATSTTTDEPADGGQADDGLLDELADDLAGDQSARDRFDRCAPADRDPSDDDPSDDDLGEHDLGEHDLGEDDSSHMSGTTNADQTLEHNDGDRPSDASSDDQSDDHSSSAPPPAPGSPRWPTTTEWSPALGAERLARCRRRLRQRVTASDDSRSACELPPDHPPSDQAPPDKPPPDAPIANHPAPDHPPSDQARRVHPPGNQSDDRLLPPTTDVVIVLDPNDPLRASTIDGDRIDSTTAALLCCDANLFTLEVDRQQVLPLEMGRLRRFATLHQRRAAAIRDGGCIFPGCDRPLRWSNLHHVVPWELCGNTDLANLACLCDHHHGVTHRSGWTMTANGDGTFRWVTPSSLVLFSQQHGRRTDHALTFA